MEKMIEELKARMENSTQSSTTFQAELSEAQNTIRILEDDKKHLTSKLAVKEREIEDANEDLRKLKRQIEVEWRGRMAY
jgi:septal ring factor EnvC (AmiA/AmiB activator)